MTELIVKTRDGSYPVRITRGGLSNVGGFFDLDRRVLVVTDDGVPEIYAKCVLSACREPHLCVLPQGESTKNLDNFCRLLQILTENGFTRGDCVVAVGGGVVGDLAGFAAASFLRGIDFYNVPTTLLSQVDSSVGGKTAVDFMGYKNLVGAFYPPKAVWIDIDTLKSLPKRQLACGLAEALKMGMTSDKALFSLFENGVAEQNLEEVVVRAVTVKKAVVEQDERENGLRRVLNFGHTLGHAIESADGTLLHGECVALGMLPFCAPSVRERLLPILKTLGLPTEWQGDREKLCDALTHDKKAAGDSVTIVLVPEIGHFALKKMPMDELLIMIRRGERL